MRIALTAFTRRGTALAGKLAHDLSEVGHSCALAVPAARKNSMLASTVPGFSLGIARQGAPLSLANAFEIPVKGESPLSKAREAMLTHWQELKKLYGITADCEAILPEKPLDQIIRELVEYVR